MTELTKGVFFVATGDTCRAEACFALTKLKRSNPGLPATGFACRLEGGAEKIALT